VRLNHLNRWHQMNHSMDEKSQPGALCDHSVIRPPPESEDEVANAKDHTISQVDLGGSKARSIAIPIRHQNTGLRSDIN
jgi:hypothetical protein